MNENFSLGEKIRSIRKEKGLTLSEMAFLLHTSQGYLSDIENDKAMPNFKLLSNLRKEMFVDLNNLFAEDITGNVVREVLSGYNKRNQKAIETLDNIDKLVVQLKNLLK